MVLYNYIDQKVELILTGMIMEQNSSIVVVKDCITVNSNRNTFTVTTKDKSQKYNGRIYGVTEKRMYYIAGNTKLLSWRDGSIAIYTIDESVYYGGTVSHGKFLVRGSGEKEICYFDGDKKTKVRGYFPNVNFTDGYYTSNGDDGISVYDHNCKIVTTIHTKNRYKVLIHEENIILTDAHNTYIYLM